MPTLSAPVEDVATPRPTGWLAELFGAQTVAKGGIVRRKRRSVERYVTLASLLAEVRRRGFHLIEHGEDLIILCSAATVRVVC